MKLNDMRCRNAQPKTKPYKLTDGQGLYLEVLPNGNRYWRLKYYVHGRERRIAFGKYPGVSLLEARKKREEARDQIANGKDPAALRQEQKQQSIFNGNQTFEAVAREWHKRNYSTWTERHAKYQMRRFEYRIFGEIGHMLINEMRPHHIAACVQKIEDTAPEMAKRALHLCCQVLRYAALTGRLENDITFSLKGILKKQKKRHFASINLEELPVLLNAIYAEDNGLFPQTRLAIRLMLLTFVRTSELIQARWEEFDLDKAVWSIPAERMKMRKPHLVPLSRQAIEIVRELKRMNGHREFVFPSISRPRKTMSNCTILVALKRIGFDKKMTGHGFRALAMGLTKEKLGYRHEVIDRQLAHEPKSSVDRAYDRSSYIGERTVMMQRYADYIDNELRQQRRKENAAREPRQHTTNTITAQYRIPAFEGSIEVHPGKCVYFFSRSENGQIPTTH